MSDELRQLVAEILGVKTGEVADDWGPGAADTWDSLNHLRIICAIEQELGIQFSMEEVQDIKSFAGLTQLVAARSSGE